MPVSFGRVAFAFLVLCCAAIAINPPVSFVDLASSDGLTVSNTFGGKTRKDYILETTGNGVAIFDYDRDGAEDIFIANGTTLGESAPGRHLPQLYHNDGRGHFTDVAAHAGFTTEGWGQGVCVGDYDNDGWPDLLVTYYGHNRLYRNQGDGTFRDVTAQAKLPVDGTRFGSGCSFVDYDRDGLLDLFIANYVDLDLSKDAEAGRWRVLRVEGNPRHVRTARASAGAQYSVPQQWRWHLHRRFRKGRHSASGRPLLSQRGGSRLRERRLAGYLRGLRHDSESAVPK